MSTKKRKLLIRNENWRGFFNGDLHLQLSLALSEAYVQLFQICVEKKLISEPKDAITRLSSMNSKDLSDTTNLIFIRVLSVLRGPAGNQKNLTVTQILNQASRDLTFHTKVGDSESLRETLQKARELENISNLIKLGRNMNAHMQSPILDVGFSLQICAAILRLFEIFDFQRVKSEKIEALQSTSQAIILNAVDGKELAADEIHFQNKFSDDEIRERILKEPEESEQLYDLEEVDAEESNVEVPIKTLIKSNELQRQALERLKSHIVKDLLTGGSEFSKKDLLLSGSTLTDILMFKPRNVNDLKKVLSVQILLSRNQEFVEFQIQKFGKKIVSIF